jgi:CubicO group peptidase (beta-lactamase class C family)
MARPNPMRSACFSLGSWTSAGCSERHREVETDGTLGPNEINRERKMKRLVVSTYILLATVPSISHSQNRTVEREAPASQIKNIDRDDPQELESYLDEFINKKMQEYHIPGLVFVMVKNGKIFLGKGYGFSDLEKKVPVKPNVTVFRVGSLSKLFTATAVMQLCEQGKLDLHADVNQYLKLFKLEENYAEPVTAYNLLTHTAGFRGRAFGVLTRKESERKPLGEFLATNMPPRSLPPSTVINYSNYDSYLAGHLVEVVSGLSFDRYVEENILRPLGMEKSSFVLPDRLLPDLAKGYSYENGASAAVPPEYTVPLSSPAGSLVATGEDVARFMIAQLQGGYYLDHRILSEGTCREMQKRQFANDPRLPGTCYGFYEYENYNQRAIMHDGDVSGFSSRLFLLPEHNLGFFVCNNSGNSILRMQLTDHLMSRYFGRPEQPPVKEATKDSQSPDRRLAGSYRSLRFGLDSFDKLSYSGAVMLITERTAGICIELEPGLFQVPKTSTRIAVREDEKGDIKYLFLDAQQMPITYEKLAWYENFLRFPHVWFSAFGVVFIWIGIVRPIYSRIRARRKPSVETPRLVGYTQSSAALTSVIHSIFLAGFTPAFLLGEDQLAFGVPWVIRVLLVLPVINLGLTAAFIIFVILSWKDPYWDWKKHLYYSLVILLFVGFNLYLDYWNLLGFKY